VQLQKHHRTQKHRHRPRGSSRIVSCWWRRLNPASSCLSAKNLVHRSKAITASAMLCNAPPKPAKSCRTSLRFFRPSPFPGSNSYLFQFLPLSLHLRFQEKQAPKQRHRRQQEGRLPSKQTEAISHHAITHHPAYRRRQCSFYFNLPHPHEHLTLKPGQPTNQSHHTLSLSPYLQGIPPAQFSSQLPTPNRLFPQSEPHHWSVTVHPPAAQHTHIQSSTHDTSPRAYPQTRTATLHETTSVDRPILPISQQQAESRHSRQFLTHQDTAGFGYHIEHIITVNRPLWQRTRLSEHVTSLRTSIFFYYTSIAQCVLPQRGHASILSSYLSPARRKAEILQIHRAEEITKNPYSVMKISSKRPPKSANPTPPARDHRR
ncbi:hypothetical protein GQ607_003725, partial [Colletotrichum asianum]